MCAFRAKLVAAPARSSDVLALPDPRTRERVPVQPLPHAETAHRDRARALPHRATDQDLVPEPPDEGDDRHHQCCITVGRGSILKTIQPNPKTLRPTRTFRIRKLLLFIGLYTYTNSIIIDIYFSPLGKLAGRAIFLSILQITCYKHVIMSRYILLQNAINNCCPKMTDGECIT